MPPHLHPSADEIARLPTPLNAGEKDVLDRLMAVLHERWHVFVQPSFLNHHPDFVLVEEDQGVTVIEVKGWTPSSYRAAGSTLEVWYPKEGRWGPSEEDPLSQAHRYRTALADSIVASPDGDSALRRVKATVWVPRAASDFAGLLSSTTALDPGHVPFIEFAGVEAMTSVAAARRAAAGGGRHTAALHPGEMRRVLDRLREGDAVREQRSPLELSAEALAFARRRRGNRKKTWVRGVDGAAGCGKSVALAARAAVLAARGKRVLLLAYNITLPHYLSDLSGRHARSIGADRGLIDCVHFHGFCKQVADGWVGLGGGEQDEDYEFLVSGARQRYEGGGRDLPRYDAVLVDEGSDFRPHWWGLLSDHVVLPGGELVIAADHTQSLYNRDPWMYETGAPNLPRPHDWTTLTGSYRLPADVVPVLADFVASAGLTEGEFHLPSVPPDRLHRAMRPTVRRWVDATAHDPTSEEVAAIAAHEVGRILSSIGEALEVPPAPADVTVIVPTHALGMKVAAALSPTIEVESMCFSHEDPRVEEEQRRRRKHRFWPGVPLCKIATVHSFKGWESRAVVVVLAGGNDDFAIAYTALTRLKGHDVTRRSFITVVNADPDRRAYQPTFLRDIGPDEVPGLLGQTTIAVPDEEPF